MSYKNEHYMKLVKDIDKLSSNKSKVTDKQAEEAFKTILHWIGNERGIFSHTYKCRKCFV